MPRSSHKPLQALLAAFCALSFCFRSSGCLRPDGSDDAQYVALGAQFATNLLSLKVIVPGVGVGYRYASAVLLNREYALTAAHAVTDLLQFNPTYQIGTGPNYMTNAGVQIPATVLVYPGYDPNAHGSTIDLAIIHFSQPLSGTPVTISSPPDRAILSHAGFGMFGTPSGGINAKDGNSRGWLGKLDSVPVLSGYSETYYSATDFGHTLPGNGKGLSGDSGGGVYDGTNLVGVMIAQTGDSEDVGATIFLNLAQAEVHSWIVANTPVSIRPKLSIQNDYTIQILGQANAVFKIQGSIDLTNWLDVGAVSNETGTVFFTDPDRSNFPKRFYRTVTY